MEPVNFDSKLPRLYEILRECTQVFRKGEVVREEQKAHVTVITLDFMPHTNEADNNLQMIDCHFINIGVDKQKADEHKDELISILDCYPDERLKQGISYIEAGATIGSQTAAFSLYALGEVLGLWRVMTPKMMHIEDEAQANELAGRGFIYNVPIKQPKEDERPATTT